jgi:hypothetical protein
LVYYKKGNKMPVIKNKDECCVYKAPVESEIVVTGVECNDGCKTEPTNNCGITHPKGSGTLAGCKSTTLPHFGVVLAEAREGTCRTFGYYTSGNTEEYENVCGGIDKLIAEEVVVPCDTKTVFTTESCDCFEVKEESEAADVAQDALIAANVDNTDTGVITVVDGKVYTTLEDGTQVLQGDAEYDLAGNLLS